MKALNLALAAALVASAVPCPTARAATTYYVATTGNDASAGTSASPWRTIQKAANVAGAGDTVVVRAGTYVGAKFASSGTSAAPIVFHGDPGAIVSSPGAANSNGDNLWVRDASYVTIEGFEVRAATRAGIAVQAEPDAESHGVVLQNNFCHDNSRWGIFTAYAEGIRIENNECSGSAIEHGVYVSNSSDNPVIRNNRAHDNHASGIQINADPALDGDGIISNAVVERNVIWENGVAGGAAINLASVIQSTIRNNVLYNNHATGIAGWDDGDGNQFGTHDNTIAYNTIVQASDGRNAMSLIDGSFNNVVKDNVLIHPGTRGSLEIDASSEPGIASDYNVVVDRFSVDDTFITFAQWKARGHDAHSFVANATATFADATNHNYHLKSTSTAIDAGTAVSGTTTDRDGKRRPQGPGVDIGAYEFRGADTAGVYVGGTSAWFLRNANSSGGADVSFVYGAPAGLVALSGDWNGDGVDSPGLYNPTTGVFVLRNSASPGPADFTFQFGAGNAGLVPIVGDWNGDGTDTVGVYNPATGSYFLRNANAGGGADAVFSFGPAGAGWTPLSGDWDGDGTDTIGLYDPSNGVFFLKNTNAGGGADLAFAYGGAFATPLVGDWNADGIDSIGVYAASTGAWFLRNSNASGGGDVVFVYGPSNVTPVDGDWDSH